MKNRINNQEATGSITVFLTLILLLILSLLLTIIEGARVSTAKVFAERALSTAMDSVLADYYGPLWDEYHVFGYYPGDGTEDEVSDHMSSVLENYMSYTFEPDKDLDIAAKKENYELFDITTDSVSLNGATRLLDYQGELLINEAVEYMKYAEMGNGIEQLLDKMSLLDTPKKISYIYEEKQKVEEELVEIDKGILELMEQLDGLNTSKKGIEVTKKGELKTADYFVKKICFNEITKETVGINQDNVFFALKNNYVNPIIDFEAIITDFSSIDQAERQIGVIEAEKYKVETKLSQEQIKLDKLNEIEKKSKEDKKQIKTLKKTIKTLNSDIKGVENTASEQENYKLSLISKITTSMNNIIYLTSSMKPIINKSITTIDNLLVKTEVAAPLINQYETFLMGQKESIDEKVFTGLEENLGEMKKYVAVDGSGYDFKGMKVILQKDLSVLNQVENLLNQGKYELSQSLYLNSKTSAQVSVKEIEKYQISGLSLDYSTLVLDKSSQGNPLSQINDLLQSGITSMVIKPDQISDSKLTQEILPSEVAAMSDEDTDFFTMLKSFFKDASIGGNNSGMGNLFNSFGDKSQILSMAGDGANMIAEHFLYQEYLKEHFGMFKAEKEDNTSRKPSVLDYEQEYLLVGKTSDQENLASVISRLVFLRTIIDFVSVIGDSAKRNEARAVATALVGFTGLPFLISITQVVILLCWSLAEALLDVCALVKGMEVPILKKEVVLKLPEIFMVNREFLEEKAEKTFRNNKENSLSYQDYLRIFLLMKSKKDLAYRSMDLMQENINIRYNQDINLYNCLFGFRARADFTIAPKFLGVSYVKKYLNINSEGFLFTTEAEYSY